LLIIFTFIYMKVVKNTLSCGYITVDKQQMSKTGTFDEREYLNKYLFNYI